MKTRLTAFALLGLLSLATAQEPEYLEAFPPAKEGMERFVIKLPFKSEDEAFDFKVELNVGKEILTDGCDLNQMW